jgi:lipopolysaccharide/colanic/teichoic acid biosynthesis glycosyltransferase
MIRLFDTLLSITGLILFSPVFIIISLLIFFESRGGIFYTQNRVGKNNKDFRLFKFRTMFVNSDKQSLLTIGSKDTRITKIGYYLRKYKIDELPQLLNVFIGDMSIVGPRPEVRKYVEIYTEEQKEVLTINPGITDYASIKFINENELLLHSENPEETYIKEILPAKIDLNLKFIRSRSLILYFKIIILTILKITR